MDSPLEQLIQISHNRTDNLVTPLVIEYTILKDMGFEKDYILNAMREHYER